MGRSGLIGLVPAIALLPAALAAAGQPVPSTIRLSIRDCYPPSLSAVDTFSALSLELKQDGAHRVLLTSSPQAAVDAELDVTVSCDPKVEATIVLVAARTARERSRAVRLDDVKPKDRPRALALIAAEFVRREWSGLDVAQAAQETQQREVRPAPAGGPPETKDRVEPTSEPGPNSPPPSSSRSDENARESTGARAAAVAAVAPSVTDAEASRAASSPGPRSEPAIAAWGAARWFTDYGSRLLGGSAGLEFDRVAFHLEALTSGQSTHLGAASTSLVAAAASWKAWQGDAGPMRFTLAATGALGITWASATPDRDTVKAQNAQALYADLRLSAKAGTLLGPLWLRGGLEGGRAAGMASFAEGEVAGATGGWFVGLTLGVAYPLPGKGGEKNLAR